MRLFIDFDNTLVQSTKQIVNLYNQDYQFYRNYEYVDWRSVKSYDFKELKCATSDLITAYFTYPRFFKGLEFFTGAYELLTLLNTRKFVDDITIVTLGWHSNLELKKMFCMEIIPFVNLHGIDIDVADKSSIDMSDGIFIDDVPEYLNTTNAKYKICFGDFGYNKDWNGVRCKNWSDIRIFLEQIGVIKK